MTQTATKVYAVLGYWDMRYAPEVLALFATKEQAEHFASSDPKGYSKHFMEVQVKDMKVHGTIEDFLQAA